MKFYRKVIRIRAEDSPNVRLALAQKARGMGPTGEVIIPGVLPWAEYVKRRLTWDRVKQCIGLDAQFYEGAETLLFPPEWLNRAEFLATYIASKGIHRKAEAIGIDPAEGGDKTAMVAIDRYGVIEVSSKRTPDTNRITGEAIAFIRKYSVPSQKVLLDRGGGGKIHADRLRAQGFKVRTVSFGESLALDPKRGITLFEERLSSRESRYTYRNRRAQMYGMLRDLLDPGLNEVGFGLPAEYPEIRRQLAPIPFLLDEEGRLELPPKRRRMVNVSVSKQDTRPTLISLLGCSPDEADALVLAVYGMLTQVNKTKAGPMFRNRDSKGRRHFE